MSALQRAQVECDSGRPSFPDPRRLPDFIALRGDPSVTPAANLASMTSRAPVPTNLRSSHLPTDYRNPNGTL
jgi:hypothetical protein